MATERLITCCVLAASGVFLITPERPARGQASPAAEVSAVTFAKQLDQKYPRGAVPFGIQLRTRPVWPLDCNIYGSLSSSAPELSGPRFRGRLRFRLPGSIEIPFADEVLSGRHLHPQIWVDFQQLVGYSSVPLDSLSADVFVDELRGAWWHPIWSSSVDFEVKVSGSIESVVAKTQISTDEVTAALKPRIERDAIRVNALGLQQLLRKHPRVTFGVRLVVECEGRDFCTADAWWRDDPAFLDGDIVRDEALTLHPQGVSLSELVAQCGTYPKFRVEPNPSAALRDVNCTEYWSPD